MDLSERDESNILNGLRSVGAAWKKVSDTATAGYRVLEKRKRSLQDISSRLPEIRNFLHPRGLEHVSDLDAQGVRELKEHLKSVLRDLTIRIKQASPIQSDAHFFKLRNAQPINDLKCFLSSPPPSMISTSITLQYSSSLCFDASLQNSSET